MKDVSLFQEKSNFLALFQAKGNVSSYGDSFYDITDKVTTKCIHQVVDSVVEEGQ